MSFDPKGVEKKRANLEKSVAHSISMLETTLSRFRTALQKRRDERERCYNSFMKLTERRRETVTKLKKMVEKTEKLKHDIHDKEEELDRIRRKESVMFGRYKELLAGRAPAGDTTIPGVLNREGFDALHEKKVSFLTSVRNAFEDIEGDFDELKKRKERLTKEIKRLNKQITEHNRAREMHLGKLKIYGRESDQYEKKLRESVKSEETLLEIYAGFGEDFKEGVILPPSSESILLKNLNNSKPS